MKTSEATTNKMAAALKTEGTKTYTENGAECFNTTNNAVLDFFSVAGALRNADPNRVERLFESAYSEDPLLTMKTLFYMRDIRGGLGERDVFRYLLTYAAKKYPESVVKNIELIPEYGRYDDLYAIITNHPYTKPQVITRVINFIKDTLAKDIEALKTPNCPVSLLGKWLKSPNTSSEESRMLGKDTAKMLDMSEKNYRQLLSKLRERINIVERLMSENRWSEIKYENQTARVMNQYAKAFVRHDEKRFNEYITDVKTGKTKINAGTLYPYDIIRKLDYNETTEQVCEAQWKAMPDYIGGEHEAIVMADTSGSMLGLPMEISVSLALYFAERNKGAYHNMFMTFSSKPEIINLNDNWSLEHKMNKVMNSNWGFNTDLEAAFDKILDVAIKNDIKPEEMVKSLIIISDMEFDRAVRSDDSNDWDFYDQMVDMFEKKGYKIPNVVFWNANSRNETYHTDANRKGVQLVSGASASTFKTLMGGLNKTPTEMMLDILNSERYDKVTV